MTEKINLIFIHGFRGNSQGLKEVAEHFDSKKYQTFVPDLPPAGGNSFKKYTADNYANFIADYIRKNHIKKPVLIGHSMGSIIVAATAEKYPKLLSDKIVFLAPISKKPATVFSLLSPLSSVFPNKIVTYITTKYLSVEKDRKKFKKILRLTEECGADYVHRSDVMKAAWFSSRNAISDFKFEKQALFLSGEKERLIPRRVTETVAKTYRANTVYIKDAGHLLNYESPKATADAIKSFLAD